MKVDLYDEQRDLSISADSVEKLVSFLFSTFKITSDEILVHFVSEKEICELHDTFFNDPTSTDCITFPIDPPFEKHSGPTVLGEAFICPKAAIEYAEKHQIDPYEETSRYLVHSILHLLGYDDLRPDERTKMRAKENQCVKLLKDKGLLLKKS